jgi:hypothetical protein
MIPLHSLEMLSDIGLSKMTAANSVEFCSLSDKADVTKSVLILRNIIEYLRVNFSILQSMEFGGISIKKINKFSQKLCFLIHLN